jgi:arylformamidase
MAMGAVLFVLGLILYLGPRVPFLGRLPGDISIQRGNWSFYFPVVTCLLVSLLVTLILWLVSALSTKAMREPLRATGGWIDVSRPLDPRRLLVWPGDPPLEISLLARLDPRPAAGSPYNITVARLCLHSGTHIDAPRHAVPGGKGAEEIPLGACAGPARLVRHVPDRHIGRADLAGRDLRGVERLLLATTNAARAESDGFREDYVALLPDAARFLVETGVRLVGIDYLSIGPRGREGEEVHRILLQAEVVVLEGLVLKGLEPGDYELVAFPLAFVGSDGAPVRAALRPLSGPA